MIPHNKKEDTGDLESSMKPLLFLTPKSTFTLIFSKRMLLFLPLQNSMSF